MITFHWNTEGIKPINSLSNISHAKNLCVEKCQAFPFFLPSLSLPGFWTAAYPKDTTVAYVFMEDLSVTFLGIVFN